MQYNYLFQTGLLRRGQFLRLLLNGVVGLGLREEEEEEIETELGRMMLTTILMGQLEVMEKKGE